MKLGIVVTTLTAATLALGLGAVPAHAEQARYADPADASGSLTDIRAVSVRHGPSRVVVKVKFTDLRRRSDGGPAGLMIGIDTRADRSGPEFRLGTGLQAGTDYQLVRIRRGQVVGEPLSCPHQVKLDYDADILTFVAARTCLGSPDSVRLAVKMRDDWDASHPITDWLGEPGSYTDPVLSS